MKKICLIGNYSVGKNVYDGQRLKVRLYFDILKKENFDVLLVDLASFKRRPIHVLKMIKKYHIESDCTILITASGGANFLIPYINRLNQKNKRRFILPLVGTSVLHNFLDRMSNDKKNKFLLEKDFTGIKRNEKLEKQLKQIDIILPETDAITEVFKCFFHLDNVLTMTNFRKDDCVDNNKERNGVVYMSRIASMKGLFDLFDAIELLKNRGQLIRFDLYGPMQLNRRETNMFNNFLSKNPNVHYCGTIEQSNVIDTISNYKFLVFPTRYITEGTPGVLIESLISETPIITSNFPQARCILKFDVDSICFDIGDVATLANSIYDLYFNSEKLKKLSDGTAESRKKFFYNYNRKLLLECIIGESEN